MIGTRIKERRTFLKMTGEELAEKLGVIRNTVYRWEAGQRTPSDKDKKRLAEALNTSVGYLTGESNNPEKPLQWHAGEFAEDDKTKEYHHDLVVSNNQDTEGIPKHAHDNSQIYINVHLYDRGENFTSIIQSAHEQLDAFIKSAKHPEETIICIKIGYTLEHDAVNHAPDMRMGVEIFSQSKNFSSLIQAAHTHLDALVPPPNFSDYLKMTVMVEYSIKKK